MSTTDHKAIRRRVKELFEQETLYTHEMWWRLFEKRAAGIPLGQLRAFGGVLDRDDLAEMATQAFQAQPFSGVIIENGHIRPTDSPSEEKHLYKRTVFARPIPFRATEEDLQKFFGRYGAIEKVDRREWKDRQTDGKMRYKPGIFIVYTSSESAAKCVEAKPSYSRTKDIGRYHIPELTVALRSDENNRKDASVNPSLYKVIDSVGESETATKFISQNAANILERENIVVLEGIPENSEWRDMRAFYSKNLKTIRDDVIFTHLNASKGVCYLFISNAQNIEIPEDLIPFRESNLKVRLATDSDVEYLQTLPVEGGEPASKKQRTE